VGSFYSAGLAATVQTRRAQLTARTDRRGRDFGLAVVEGKLRNQINLLKYVAKYRKERQPEIYEAVRAQADGLLDSIAELDRLGRDQGDAQTIDDCRGQLLSIEGRAAQKYWAAVGKLLNPEVVWPGRQRQGAADPFNSALNYGYGILYSQVERSLVLAGLDPYAGFIHVDRPGTPSLVLDMVEEFRQTVVDRTVLAVFNRGTDIQLDDRGRMVEESRKALAEKVLARLNGTEAYDGKRFSLSAIIQSQARRAAAFFREEKETYVPHVSSW
jgi:CRISPR-associated protein Cas1